jgi:plastocyanin
VTASALDDDLNITSNGLQDGSSGYNNVGEGTSFVFDIDVTITSLDWVSFSTTASTDNVTLLNDSVNLGTFTNGTVSGGIDFTSTNPSTMNIAVTAGDAFEIQFSAGGTYYCRPDGLHRRPRAWHIRPARRLLRTRLCDASPSQVAVSEIQFSNKGRRDFPTAFFVSPRSYSSV